MSWRNESRPFDSIALSRPFMSRFNIVVAVSLQVLVAELPLCFLRTRTLLFEKICPLFGIISVQGKNDKLSYHPSMSSLLFQELFTSNNSDIGQERRILII